MKHVFFFTAKDACVAAPSASYVVAVYGFERGYYLVATRVSVEQLNGNVPADVLQAALDGSMFGWDVPAARAAVEYIEALEREAATRSPS